MARPGETRRVILQAALVAAAVLLAAWAIFQRHVYQPPPEPKPRPPVAAGARAPEEAVVVSVSGQVERSAAGGRWANILAGERLRANDSLRTAKGSRTDLRLGGERGRLTVTESTQLTIRELSDKLHHIHLAKGRISADYKPEGERLLRIEEEGGAVAETRGARFSLLSTGTAVAIATETGSVNLKAKDQAVEVAEGRQSVALRGRPPSASEPIPARILLKVANVAEAGNPVLCAIVEGLAKPGEQVLVDGDFAEVGEDGRYRVRVPRAPGRSGVLVATRDAFGHEESERIPCSEGPPPQIHDFAIRWRKSNP